ncbi:MAG: hypothetical protein ICV85_01530, partial [Tolypothrix sp. T3-bin4]|nr:hypothetical protein [Tolypothrix sp. T3-bin4]
MGKLLLSDGWFFFVPYLFFYFSFKIFHLKVTYLQPIFIALHISNILIFIASIYSFYKKDNSFNKLLFWAFIILLFLLPGAYLEFPSDAWAHFARIFVWQTSTFIDDNPTNYKFAYFWGWTFMAEVEPLGRRTALNLYSTFWQFLLAYQFYLFALRVGFSDSWAKVQVLGT